MGETIHRVNGIDICAEVRGPDDGVPLLLVMGLGAQLVSWDRGFVDALVERGYRVARFDNRDVGRSTHVDAPGLDVMAALRAAAAGEPVDAPYTLSDMAADAAGVLEALGMSPAHVVGASMGGMIVQAMAIEQPQAVRSVVSIMSTTGDRDVGQPTREANRLLLAPPPTTEDEAVERAIESEATWGSPAHRDPEAAAERARREWNRVRNPAGVGRQLVAVNASGSRTEALGRVTVPFTVVHGTDDTLVTPSGGRRTAEAVPGATLVEIEGMGHNLPRPLWPRLVDIIEDTTRRADHA
ncbi:MAG TPA: alpha/beta hydrolase [Acidimicrobiales bacterium]|nr:alpha/beta hydrolase [Acidimicrobiales bacterium]